MLEYDDSAFYFFALSTMTFYLVPSWYSMLRRVLKAFKVNDEEIGAVYRTGVEKAKAEQLKRDSRASKVLASKGFLINLGITIVFTILFIWLLVSVSQDGVVNSFDPYSILEIDPGSDTKTIKKAYRDLSKRWHPDHCRDGPICEAKFILIKKAYDTLTDKVARENWEKGGDPDGNQTLEVSIGLPTFLLDLKYRNLVLFVYLLFIVGLIPYFVWRYYSESNLYGEKNVMYNTYSWYHYALSENTPVKNLPEVLAGSAEFRKRNIPKTPEQKQAIATLMQSVRALMVKPQWNHPVIVKGNVLMHVHLLRKTDVMIKNNMEEELDDFKYMLRMSTSLIDAMISVCKNQDSLQTAVNCIELSQFVTQAMWVKDSPFLQLPHFTSDEVKQCKGKITSIQQYRDLPDDQKKGMTNFTETQKKDAMNFLNIFPDISVDCKIFVDDDEDDRVYEGDLVTVQVTIVRNNLKDGKRAGLVHAPHFPFPKKEAFWIILGQKKEGKIISIEKVWNPNKKVVHEIRFMAPPKGTYHFNLIVKSNGYVGVDQEQRFEMVTLDSSTLPEYKVHPDDAELDDEPTLFEEMLNAHIEEDSEDEDEEDSDSDKEEEEVVAKSAAEKKKEQLRKARQVADDDEDDSDAEEM